MLRAGPRARQICHGRQGSSGVDGVRHPSKEELTVSGRKFLPGDSAGNVLYLGRGEPAGVMLVYDPPDQRREGDMPGSASSSLSMRRCNGRSRVLAA